MKPFLRSLLCSIGLTVLAVSLKAQEKQTIPALIRTARSGAWSAPTTWEGSKVPSAGTRVQIRTGHRVDYDLKSSEPIRSLHIAGTLRFTPDKDTRLDVGLIRIQAGDRVDEEGFDCTGHAMTTARGPRPALLVGTPERPIAAGKTALIRLVAIKGLDSKSCPAIVCCGGRMDFHGAPMNRTWVKLGTPARAGATVVTLAEPVTGWRIGDRIILTATTRQIKLKKTFTSPSLRGHGQTEERQIKAIDGTKLTLDQPFRFDHTCTGPYRGDVANLSRNVIVESGDPATARGHTMYHRGSAGSIRYAEFRHLGKRGILGRYSLHYHLAGDTMRGSSVIGASIWDSGNRWLTIHGTNYLVVRDCVGYQSDGHGFFMEDGTEVYNVLDRNLAVQALTTKPLPQQVIPFDKNDGSGFWWANCLNTFTRNVAAECDEYGYFFQGAKTPEFDPVLAVRQPDGKRKPVDIRTLPFVRFEDNEAHCQRRHAFNLGGGVPFGTPNVGGVGPDAKHPFVIRNFRVWNSHWAIHPVAPSLLLDGLDIVNADYGIWRPVYKGHAYRSVRMTDVPASNRYAFVKPNAAPNREADYPRPMAPVDDLPPITVITHIRPLGGGKLSVSGTTSDNGAVLKVVVNGQEAKARRANFAEWEVILTGVRPGELKLAAHAQDRAGNVEPVPHRVVLDVAP
jgi:G8 domain